jgi:hypothetical protein
MTMLASGFGLFGLMVASAGSAPARATTEPCRCPCPDATRVAAMPGTSIAIPAPAPKADAFALNRAGRDLYRQRRWEEARRSYRAAMNADPGFLAPKLNVSCSFAQEERFAEAVAEAAGLLATGYVPWAREIQEATDLAPLRARPEHEALRSAIAAAAPLWGAPLDQALLFVARTGPAVNLPPQGALVLALAQEIFAYLPAAAAYRQVTAEDGRVLAFIRASNGQSVTYVRAGKLVRAAGQPPRLRGLSLRRLDLGTMAVGPAVAVPGDVERLELGQGAGSDGTEVRTTDHGVATAWRFDGQTLLAAPKGQGGRPTVFQPAVVLDGTGVPPSSSKGIDVGSSGSCRFSARDAANADGPAQVRISVPGPGRTTFPLAAPHGAGLHGLRFPGR